MTDYLLDTNAISEPDRKHPDPGFMKWLTATDELTMFTSSMVLGEIRKGIALAPDRSKRQHYETRLAETIALFGDRIINVDVAVGQLWGELMAAGQRSGKTPPAVDALLAAQCIHHGLTLVTRNRKDFEQFPDLKLLTPWSDDDVPVQT